MHPHYSLKNVTFRGNECLLQCDVIYDTSGCGCCDSRSGLKKDARKSMTVDLQEAFINLAKSIEENPPPEFEFNQKERKVMNCNKKYFVLLVFFSLYFTREANKTFS